MSVGIKYERQESKIERRILAAFAFPLTRLISIEVEELMVSVRTGYLVLANKEVLERLRSQSWNRIYGMC